MDAQPMEAFKYWAFISYSHQDRAWGNWLHRALESYRVPTRLVGRESRDGRIPKRLFPIFRDRDELPSSANLGDVINEALRQSRYQVVICSPRAAASKWVNEEVKYFKSLGREDRVLCLIVDGEPNVFDLPGRGLEECFCPALRHPAEPIAADAREHADGKGGAKLKLLAGLIGVGLDELKQRERVRARWRLFGYAAAAAAVLAMLSGVWQWQDRRRLEHSRQEAIALDLNLGRKELELGNSSRAAVFLGEAYGLGDRSTAVRYMLGQVMPSLDALDRTFVHGEEGTWTTAAFSPDGKTILTGNGVTSDARLWDARTGEVIFTVNEQQSPVGWVMFSPDGATILTNHDNQNLVLWDAKTGERIASLTGQGGYGHLFTAAFSPDSSMILTTGYADQVRIWSTRTGQLIRSWKAHSAPIRAARFSNDGRRILTGGDDRRVRLWDAGGKLLADLPAHADAILSVAFSPDGIRAASSSADGVVKLWNLAHHNLELSLVGTAGHAGTVAFTPDAQRLVLFEAKGGITVWTLPGKPVRAGAFYYGQTDGVFDPAGTLAISRGGNRARIWDLATGRAVLTLEGHSQPVWTASFSPDGRALLTASIDGTARTWRNAFSTAPPTVRLGARPRRINYDDSGRLYVTCRRGILDVVNRDASTGVIEIRDVMLDDGDAAMSAFDQRGRIAVARPSGVVEVMDGANGRIEMRVDVPATKPLRTIDLFSTANSSLLILAFDDGSLELRDVSTGAAVLRAESRVIDPPAGGRPPLFGYNRGGTLLMTQDGDAALRVHDLRTSQSRVVEGLRKPSIADLSPDGQLLFAIDEDGGRLNLLSLSDGAVVERFVPGERFHEAIVQWNPFRVLLKSAADGAVWQPSTGSYVKFRGSAGFEAGDLSPDGRLAVFSEDTTARLYDAASGALLATYEDAQRRIKDALFDPSEKFVSIATDEGLVRFWPIGQLENRDSETVLNRIRCVAPWRLDNGEIVSQRADTSACR